MKCSRGSGPASVEPRREYGVTPDMTTLGKALGGGTA